MAVVTIFMVLMFLVYNYVIFKFIDTLLENPRLTKWMRIPVGIFNSIICISLTLLSGSSTFYAYIIVGFILFVEFLFFYRDTPLRSLFCMLACIVHVMAVRSVCVASFAIGLGKTFYEVVNDFYLLVLTMGITFLILNFFVIMVIILIPPRKVKIINQHKELLRFMVCWLVLFTIYLLINSVVYGIDATHPALVSNQIVAPLTILGGLYIVLLFMFKASELLGYKEKSEKLEYVVEKERLYRTSIDVDIISTIEINYTKNEIISGFAEFKELIKNNGNNYDTNIGVIIDNTVHPEDRELFSIFRSRELIQKTFEEGQRLLSADYRRIVDNGEYKWARLNITIVRDNESGDLKGLGQIKDIDSEKRNQLELLHKAERDQLTGLYNKATTELLIREILRVGLYQNEKHALMMIDIDNFKEINDKLGHLYGDIVLAQLADSLKPLFRSDDVVGRIGGDEFFVFLKNYSLLSLLEKKAAEICERFQKTFTENDQSVSITASVGIALFQEHGTNFDELYHKADMALYTQKEKGKNGYTIYSGQKNANYQAARTEIDMHGYLQKNFFENRFEYIFKLLYESENPINSLQSVLKLIAQSFSFSRGYIYEYHNEDKSNNITFEWYDKKICKQSKRVVTINEKIAPTLLGEVRQYGKYVWSGYEELPKEEQDFLKEQEICSMLLFGMKNGSQYYGFIGFDDCETQRKLTENEMYEISMCCHLLTAFLVKQRSQLREKQHYEVIETIMDNLDYLTYVIDPESYDIIYENKKVIGLAGGSAIGRKCYQNYRLREEPCVDCPMKGLFEGTDKDTGSIYIDRFQIAAKVSASWIKWTNGKKLCLINCVEEKE